MLFQLNNGPSAALVTNTAIDEFRQSHFQIQSISVSRLSPLQFANRISLGWQPRDPALPGPAALVRPVAGAVTLISQLYNEISESPTSEKSKR